MTRSQEVQTAAYTWRSFVGEVGGVLDLFVGISMLTLFKVLEWAIKFCVVGTGMRRKSRPSHSSEMNDVKRNSMPAVAS